MAEESLAPEIEQVRVTLERAVSVLTCLHESLEHLLGADSAGERVVIQASLEKCGGLIERGITQLIGEPAALVGSMDEWSDFGVATASKGAA